MRANDFYNEALRRGSRRRATGCALISESLCDSVDLSASVVRILRNIHHRDTENHRACTEKTKLGHYWQQRSDVIFAHLCALASLRDYLLMQEGSRKDAKPERKTAK